MTLHTKASEWLADAPPAPITPVNAAEKITQMKASLKRDNLSEPTPTPEPISESSQQFNI